MILGKVDVIEIDAQERTESLLSEWYRLLDAGIEAPIVGASGKHSNDRAPGSMRTYTLMEGESRLKPLG